MSLLGDETRCAECKDGRGWIERTVEGALINGQPVKTVEVRPCPVCNPLSPSRITAPRDDAAIERHRRHQDRRMGRTDT